MRRVSLIVATSAALAIAHAATAGAIEPPSQFRVSAVGTGSISLRWHAEEGTRYRLRGRAGSDPYATATPAPGASRARLAGFGRGELVAAQVRACRSGRCSDWSRKRRQTTLLARFNGPHPPTNCAAFPASDDFNRKVAGAPRDPRSAQIMARILADGGDDLHPDFGSNPRYGIPFVVVPHDQPGVPVSYTAYGDESDHGRYPIPPGAPIEGGRGSDGDRHVLVVRRPPEPGGDCRLFELGRAFERRNAANGWKAAVGAIFDLGDRLAGQRPRYWTSADAAGLPIYPGLVTYEEASSGLIDHAIRITFERTRRAFVSPATHWASDDCNPSRPAMGMRLRLKSGYGLSRFTGTSRAIAVALRDYGAIVADNGSNFFITGSTDRRWNDENLNQLKSIPGSAFEVVRPSSATITDC